jgi:hypothetical protein
MPRSKAILLSGVGEGNFFCLRYARIPPVESETVGLRNNYRDSEQFAHPFNCWLGQRVAPPPELDDR